MRSRHRAPTGPARRGADRTRGWTLIGLISLGILGLSALFVSTTSLTSDLARGAVAVAALSLAILAATALAVLLLTVLPHRCTRSVWPPTPVGHPGQRRGSN